MKLLVIMNYRPNRGGITGQINELVKCLEKEGFKITIVSTYGSIPRRVISIVKAIIFAFKNEEILGVGAAYFGFFPILVASFAARISFRKVVFNFHDGQAPAFLQKHPWLVKSVIGKKTIICASGFVAHCFNAKGFNALEIPYHFDFSETIYKRKTNFQWSKKILWARSFMELYQPEMALEAASLALEKDNALEFHFFGDGYMLADLKVKYNRQGIVFHGFIPRDEFLEYYEKYSVLINTTAYDNFPLSIVEAGFNDLCVLSTRIGGIATIYNDQEVVFFDGPRDLADQLLNVMQNQGKYDIVRRNLHQKILTFSWHNVRTQWLEYLA